MIHAFFNTLDVSTREVHIWHCGYCAKPLRHFWTDYYTELILSLYKVS